MTEVVKRQVYYFNEPGEGDTQLVIEAVSQRLEAGGVDRVIIASTSGETAAKFAAKLKGKAELVCVSGGPGRRARGGEWPCLKQELRQEMERLGVAIIDRSPSTIKS